MTSSCTTQGSVSDRFEGVGTFELWVGPFIKKYLKGLFVTWQSLGWTGAKGPICPWIPTPLESLARPDQRWRRWFRNCLVMVLLALGLKHYVQNTHKLIEFFNKSKKQVFWRISKKVLLGRNRCKILIKLFAILSTISCPDKDWACFFDYPSSTATDSFLKRKQ